MSGRTLFVILIRVVGVYLVGWALAGIASMVMVGEFGEAFVMPSLFWVLAIVPLGVGAWIAVAAGRIADWFHWLDDGAPRPDVGWTAGAASDTWRFAARVVGLLAVLGGISPVAHAVTDFARSDDGSSFRPSRVVEAAAYALVAVVLLLVSRRRGSTSS